MYRLSLSTVKASSPNPQPSVPLSPSFPPFFLHPHRSFLLPSPSPSTDLSPTTSCRAFFDMLLSQRCPLCYQDVHFVPCAWIWSHHSESINRCVCIYEGLFFVVVFNGSINGSLFKAFVRLYKWRLPLTHSLPSPLSLKQPFVVPKNKFILSWRQ